MSRAAGALVLLLACLGSPISAQPGVDGELGDELRRMAQRDQAVRERLLPFLRDPERMQNESEAFRRLVDEQDAVDLANQRRLDEIVAERGWPGPDLVGEDANQAAWLIMQHADIEYMQRYIPRLRDAVRIGRESAANLAMVEDEISVAETGLQIYGTEVRMIDGQYELVPVKDPATLDERRAAVGLPPIDEYLSRGEQELGQPIGRSNLAKSPQDPDSQRGAAP